MLLDDKHFFDKPHRLVYHGTLITSFNNNIRSGHPTAEIGVVFGVCPERCKGECDSDDYAKITKTWGQKLPALVIKENKQLKLLASNRDLFEDSLLLCVSFTPFRGSPGSSDIFDDKTDNIKEILELCAIEERIQIFLIPFEIDGLGTYMILSHYKASNRCELTIPKDFKKANSILKQLKVDYTVPKIPRHFSFERNTKTYVHGKMFPSFHRYVQMEYLPFFYIVSGLFFASISRFPLAFMIRSSHHMSAFRQIFPSTPSKDFSHHLKPLELAFPPDPESLFAWDPERTFKIDLLGADDSDRTTCLKKAFRDGRHYVVSLNLLTGLSFPEFYGSYPIFFMKGDGVNFEVNSIRIFLHFSENI